MSYTVNEIATDYGRTRGGADHGSAGAARAIFADAYNGTQKTVQALGRETGLVAGGAVLGAADECRKDPVGTVVRAGTNVVVGAGLGTLAVAESPIIAFGAVAVGVGFTGVWAFKTLNPTDQGNKARFSKIGQALSDTWSNADDVTFNRSMQNMREGAGPIALDVGLMALGAQGARLGGAHGPAVLENLSGQESALVPAAVPNYYKSGFSGFGRVGEFFDELSLFQVRHGKVRRNCGSPETLEQRLELSDLEKGLFKGLPYHGEKKTLQFNRDLVKEILVPATHKTDVRNRTFYFKRDLR